jgi:hypothetical protein
VVTVVSVKAWVESLRVLQLVAPKLKLVPMSRNSISCRGDLSRGCRRRSSVWCSQWAFWAWVVVVFFLFP